MRRGGEYFRGRSVMVVGLGRSGLAAANLLKMLGAKVTVTDIEGEAELSQAIAELRQGVELQLGGHREGSFLKAQTIVLSPGVPWRLPVLVKARSVGIETISEIELAASLTEVPIIAVTGTNGKSTTTVLLGEILKAAGKRVSVGGNLGRPMVEMLREEGLEYLVVEVSSYQLEGTLRFRPRVALMLNLSQDHLERHGDMLRYLEAKKRLYASMGPGDYLIVNGDDMWLVGFGDGCMAHKLSFSRTHQVNQGAFLRGNSVTLRLGGCEEEVINADEVLLKGAHNLENVLASVVAAGVCGVEASAMGEVLRNFRGLEHRLQPVRTLDGVLYVNDSKGTNVGAAVKSLESFSGPIILIAGGRDKGGDYGPLRKAAEGKVKKAILIGEAKEKIAAALDGCVETVVAATMEEAVRIANRMATPGDVVLLSPACSSFDMFSDFEERGEVFKRAVESLPVRNAGR